MTKNFLKVISYIIYWNRVDFVTKDHCDIIMALLGDAQNHNYTFLHSTVHGCPLTNFVCQFLLCSVSNQLQNILHYGIRGIQGPLSIYDHFALHILLSNFVKHSRF